jgi:hypothetical protein
MLLKSWDSNILGTFAPLLCYAYATYDILQRCSEGFLRKSPEEYGNACIARFSCSSLTRSIRALATCESFVILEVALVTCM